MFALLRGEPAQINGDGETSRDFCYIDNAVQANLLAATTENPTAINQNYNIAVGNRTTLNELYALIKKGVLERRPDLRETSCIVKHVDFRPGDVRHSLADTSKARNLLGYDPKHPIRKGLDLALDWYVIPFTK